MYGTSNGSTNFGVQCDNSDTSGTALFAIGNNALGTYLTDGSGIAGTGSGTGIFGYATSADGTGIIGVGNNTSITTITGGSGGAFNGTKYGAVAFVSADDNNAIAFYGRFIGNTDTDATGVEGYCMPTPSYGYGVKGIGGWVGVYGETDANGFYGVYSNGDSGASGTKSFVIDYPLDPENKILKHFSIESNEVLNVYRGNVILNKNGEAIVQMPIYFLAVNKNFSYDLTPIGQPTPNIHIKREIDKEGTFVIAGGNPGQKISWHVYAERNDPYLQYYPEKRKNIIDKKAKQKGKYFMPELYGQTDDKKINFNNKVNKLQKSVQKKKIVTKRSIIKQPESKIKK